MRTYLLTLLLLLVLVVVFPFGARAVDPPWLVLARAERLMDQAEFGQAIQMLRRALQLSPDDPQAYHGLGRAYRAVNDLEVAEEYLQRALVHRERFMIADDALLVRYELADIARIRRDFASFEQELYRIVAEVPLTQEELEPNPHRLLAGRGLDRFLVLYRLDENGAAAAHGMLAELLVGLGRYSAAAEHGTIAVLQRFTTLVSAAMRRDPTYQFTTVVDLFERVRDHPEVRDYLGERPLYRELYFLAAAFWGHGDRIGLDLWRTLAAVDPDGTWGGRAARQVVDPRPEPLLVPGR